MPPFQLLTTNSIKLYLHFETADGSISEGIEKLHPGQDFYRVTFEQFLADGSAIMEAPDVKLDGVRTLIYTASNYPDSIERYT